jgi:imidazolonepropionase-like amidohydrolase
MAGWRRIIGILSLAVAITALTSRAPTKAQQAGQDDGGVTPAAQSADQQARPEPPRPSGAGKYVTPGVIDLHTHLGVYPAPAVGADATRADRINSAGYREAGTFAFRSSSQSWMRLTCVTGE